MTSSVHAPCQPAGQTSSVPADRALPCCHRPSAGSPHPPPFYSNTWGGTVSTSLTGISRLGTILAPADGLSSPRPSVTQRDELHGHRSIGPCSVFHLMISRSTTSESQHDSAPSSCPGGGTAARAVGDAGCGEGHGLCSQPVLSTARLSRSPAGPHGGLSSPLGAPGLSAVK